MNAPEDRVRAAYAQGLGDGHAWGDTDVDLGLGTTSEWLRAAREDVATAATRETRAYAVGYLRGYREAVRSFAHGRWGL